MSGEPPGPITIDGALLYDDGDGGGVVAKARVVLRLGTAGLEDGTFYFGDTDLGNEDLQRFHRRCLLWTWDYDHVRWRAVLPLSPDLGSAPVKLLGRLEAALRAHLAGERRPHPTDLATVVQYAFEERLTEEASWVPWAWADNFFLRRVSGEPPGPITIDGALNYVDKDRWLVAKARAVLRLGAAGLEEGTLYFGDEDLHDVTLDRFDRRGLLWAWDYDRVQWRAVLPISPCPGSRPTRS